MNKLCLKSIWFSLIASLAMAANVAMAHGGGMANEAYVGDSNKHLLLDSSGNCVRTSSWSKENALKECDPDLFPEKKVVSRPTPPPPPKPRMPVYTTVSLSANALFDFNSDALKSAGKDALDSVVSKIQRTDNVTNIKVIGHTDSTGPEEYNQALSLRRATTVRDYLAGHGVNSKLITVTGMGESSPVASNATNDGRAQNRRVDVSIGVSRRQ